MASKRRLRRNACDDKVRHLTMTDANAAAYFTRKKFNSFVRAYGCKFCGGFHVGHPDKKTKHAIAAKNKSRR
jgi:hypothetical protein